MQKRRESSERRGRRRLYGVVFLRLPYKSCRTSHAPSSFCQPVFYLLFSTLKFKSSSPSSGSPLEPPPHSAAYNESWIRASSGMPVVEGRPNMLYCMLSSVYCFRSAWWWYLIPPLCRKGKPYPLPAFQITAFSPETNDKRRTLFIFSIVPPLTQCCCHADWHTVLHCRSPWWHLTCCDPRSNRNDSVQYGKVETRELRRCHRADVRLPEEQQWLSQKCSS